MTFVGLAMDRFRSRLKLAMVLFLSVSTLAYVWLALITFDVVPYTLWQLYVSFVVVREELWSGKYWKILQKRYQTFRNNILRWLSFL